MTSYLLDELEWLEKAATPKEWRVKNVNESKFDYMWGPEYKPVFYIEAGHGLGEGGNSPTESNLVNITPKQVHMSEGNVKLIVALRNAAPSLFQSLRSLMAENEALNKRVEEESQNYVDMMELGDAAIRKSATLQAENEALKKACSGQQSNIGRLQSELCSMKAERDKYHDDFMSAARRECAFEAQLKDAVDALKRECYCTDGGTHPSTCDPCATLAKLGAAQKEGGMHPNWYSEDSGGTVYSKEHGDSEVTCRSCKRTFLTDPMDAACRLCGNWFSAKKEGG